MGIGDWISENIMGSTNKERATGRKVRSDNYQYGGKDGGAEEAAFNYEKRGRDAQGRGATQTTGVKINYGQANADRALGQQARSQQNSLAQVMQNRATGGAPTVAQMQADRQMQQAQAQQAAMAGSARGAGGLAAAGRNAAFGMANAAADISGQAQINAAGERRDDTNAAAGMYANLRGGDLASQQQMAGQAQAATQSAAQQNQFNAGLRDAQSARNDARQLSYDQLGNQVQTTQLAARGNYEAQQSANALGAQGINAGVGGQNANMAQQNGMNALGAAQSVAGGVAGGMIPGKATGGPVAGGKPYIVGEKGPELIVPPKDGYVLTHEQTKQAMRSPDVADTVLSTWGVGPGVERNPEGTFAWNAERKVESDAAAQRESDERLSAPGAGNMAVPGFSTGTGTKKDEPLRRRDEEASGLGRAKEAQGLELSEREQYEADGANYRLGRTKKLDRLDAPPRSTLASVLGDMGKKEQQAAAAVDTSYHGGGHYTPPQLIPLRAMGGPVSGGMPFIGGEQGPEMLVPLSGPGAGAGSDVAQGLGVQLGAGGGITSTDLRNASTGLAGQSMRGMVGGGGITGGMNVPGREDGGPVEGGKPYVTGERGPEIVVPSGYAEGARSQAEELQTRDLAFSTPHLGALHTGQQALTYGAAKVAEHLEKQRSKEAAKAAEETRVADAAKTGRWDGDRYIPAKRYDASRPFGERFVSVDPPSAPARQMKSFERTDPAKEQESIEHEEAARTNLTTAATAPTVAGTAIPLAAGVAHYLQSLFSRNNAKKKVDDDDKKPEGSRIAAVTRGR